MGSGKDKRPAQSEGEAAADAADADGRAALAKLFNDFEVEFTGPLPLGACPTIVNCDEGRLTDVVPPRPPPPRPRAQPQLPLRVAFLDLFS